MSGRGPLSFFFPPDLTTRMRSPAFMGVCPGGGGGAGRPGGAPPGGPRGPGGVPGGVPGGPTPNWIKSYADPTRPHNSGFWIGMTPRDDRDGRGGSRGGQK
jgi:hypothetical protein